MPRREFLYDITCWEARAIIKGYRKRGKIFMQLLAENVYASTFTMRDSEGKTVVDMFPSLFDNEDDSEPAGEEYTAEDISQMQAEMDAWNSQMQAEWDATHPNQ